MNIQSAKIKNKLDSIEPDCLIIILDNNVQMSIPLDPANTDYANFKRHLQGLDENGNSIAPVELQDADGNTMSPEEVTELLATLP